MVVQIISNDPTQNCNIKGSNSNWKNLPKDKSLFHTSKICGLPIGNLTSQIFANFYMNTFDHFIKSELKIKYYGRYVDDFVIVHLDKAYLQSLIFKIDVFLIDKLGLRLHPQKIQLHSKNEGVLFVGAMIKPNRSYIGNRIKSNFYNKIEILNALVVSKKPSDFDKLDFQASINSYFGIMKHQATYQLRKKIFKNDLSFRWRNRIFSAGGFGRIIFKIRKEKKLNYFL